MSGRTGGVSTYRTVNENIYFHPLNAKELVYYLAPHIKHLQTPTVLDACCGKEKSLGKAVDILDIGHTIDYVDLVYGDDVLDLDDEWDIIICNPPWSIKHSHPIYWHLIDQLAFDGVLFFVINNVFCYQGSERAEFIRFNKYYFLPRWAFKHQDRSLLDCGVLVYHADGMISQDAASLKPYIPLSRQYK